MATDEPEYGLSDLRAIYRSWLTGQLQSNAIRDYLRNLFTENLNESLRDCYGEDAPQFSPDDPQVVESHDRHMDLLDHEPDEEARELRGHWTGTTWALPQAPITIDDIETAYQEIRSALQRYPNPLAHAPDAPQIESLDIRHADSEFRRVADEMEQQIIRGLLLTEEDMRLPTRFSASDAAWLPTRQSTPLEDIRAIDALTEQHGIPISGTSGAVYLNGNKIGDVTHWEGTIRPRPQPSVCDLSTDAIACAILRAWARQPWAEVHRCALLDRMVELGQEGKQDQLVTADALQKILGWGTNDLPRRYVRRRLHWWRDVLIAAFGRFE